METSALAIVCTLAGLIVGFGGGYGVREFLSQRRRARERMRAQR